MSVTLTNQPMKKVLQVFQTRGKTFYQPVFYITNDQHVPSESEE